MKMKMKMKACELCNQQASLYCPSDSAFLCSNCDTSVHQANFLVARHIRHFLCSKCNRFTGNHFSGAAISPRLTPTCRSCLPENPSDEADSFPFSSSSSLLSSSCVSSSESCAKATAMAPKKIKVRNTMAKRVRSCSSSVTDDGSSAVEQGGSVAVFVKWSRELGLGVKGSCVASLASHALGFCLGKWRGLPFRVAAATSFWYGLRFCGDRSILLATFRNLTRLEAISGVPAKLILAAHAKLTRVFKHRREFHFHQQEGWDES